jgi:hypothetical protein
VQIFWNNDQKRTRRVQSHWNNERDNNCTPEGCEQWSCAPPGVGSFLSVFRGCRPTASTPG